MASIVVLLSLLVHIGLADDIAPTIESRLAESTYANIRDFPYFVGLSNCGGTILSPLWIITAAHCLKYNNQQEYMRLLRYPIYVGGETQANSIRLAYTEIITHPNADLALLKLARPLTFTDTIKPVRLPQYQYPEGNYIALGRGLLEPDGRIANHLRKLDVTKLSTEECLSPFRTDKNLFYTQKEFSDVATSNVICVKRRYASAHGRPLCTCMGDSGSALVANDGVIVGVLGHSRYNEGKPNISVCGRLSYYTSVFPYMSWIKQIITRQ